MTELIWDGKYDKTGKKVAPPRIILPFQTVETVNESAADRDRNLSLFGGGPSSEWRNRLVWGDKKFVLPSLLPELAGKVNLIYIDPPFDTGANFSYLATIPDAPQHGSTAARQHGKARVNPNPLTPSPGDEDTEADADASAPSTGGAGLSFVKEPSVIEQKAYRDTWGKGLDSYLKWFYETVVLLRELLAEDGSLYVHLDLHVAQYAKCVLDEVFGTDNFDSEIIWKRKDAQSSADTYGLIHDNIYFYRKGTESRFHKQFVPLSAETADNWYSNIEEVSVDTNNRAGKPIKAGTARRFNKADISAPGARVGTEAHYKWKGHWPPSGRHWAYREKIMQQLENENRLTYSANGRVYEKRYLDESVGVPAQSIWADISFLRGMSKSKANSEWLDYPTQKPEALLERIVKASSNPGDLVLDCFCGSGTTAAVAEKLGRRWITCDLGRFAIHTARKRLLGIPNVTPFVVQNLGKYERQAWQTAEFGERADAIAHNYRQFILSLYRAQPMNGYVWLHGVKAGRMVHVGDVAAPISTGDVAQIAAEFKRLMGSGKDAPTEAGIDILGWDFAFELNEVAKQQAALAGIAVRFVRIPREVLEKKAVEQGDIKFFELAALSVAHQVRGRTVRLELTDFVIPLDDVPQEIQAAITHWEQWVDYWAVDWDNHGDTFHNQWQDYRTRAKRTLQRVITSPPGTYAEAGEYRIVVKVIDILGNDTTKTLIVQVN